MAKSVLVAFAKSGWVAAALSLSAGPVGAGPDVVSSNEEEAAASRSARVAHSGAGHGGDFIELLVTGGQAGARSAPREAQQQLAAYAPGEAEPNVRREIDPVFQRTLVDFESKERPGTIVVDSNSRFLYFVLGRGRALRYGIGVGRPGFTWTGVKTVSRKARWPDWTPPKEMLARRPDLPRHMAGGPDNPLGARALYLGSSLYRIHGTNEPHTIGRNVSSGCFRMMNEDVADLYDRVRVGARVVVR
jgi:lipoprotein-anchoring transpeptidase ErfK/SrfK